MAGRIYGKYIMADIESLADNPLQPQSRATEVAVEALVEEYRHSNFLAPIIAVALRRRPGTYMVCDGHRRKAAAKIEGDTQVAICVIEGDPQEMFVRLNGGIRNVKGGDWSAVWAVAEDSDHILGIIRARYRHKIQELIRVFGETRAKEIGAAGKSAEIVVQINAVKRMLDNYEEQLDDMPTVRKIGEWMIKHRAQRWVRENSKYSLHTARNIAVWIKSDSAPRGRGIAKRRPQLSVAK